MMMDGREKYTFRLSIHRTILWQPSPRAITSRTKSWSRTKKCNRTSFDSDFRGNAIDSEKNSIKQIPSVTRFKVLIMIEINWKIGIAKASFSREFAFVFVEASFLTSKSISSFFLYYFYIRYCMYFKGSLSAQNVEIYYYVRNYNLAKILFVVRHAKEKVIWIIIHMFK